MERELEPPPELPGILELLLDPDAPPDEPDEPDEDDEEEEEDGELGDEGMLDEDC